jgi:steroid delta-isomerase
VNTPVSVLASASPHADDLRRLVIFFEALTVDNAKLVDTIYSDDAFFKDPFNEVTGTAEIRRLFEHMFHQVDGPRFIVTTQVLQGDQAFLTWDFIFRMKRFSRAEQCIRGATHLRFNADGKCCLHRDYWDAAEELYEKLPVLGGLMRVLKKAARS